VPDVKNLLNFGGLRPGLDIFQMDAGLSYGLTEYGRMIALLEKCGFDRKFAFPHGGHLINLHIASGLNLGGCEAYPGVFQPFGGVSRNAGWWRAQLLRPMHLVSGWRPRTSCAPSSKDSASDELKEIVR